MQGKIIKGVGGLYTVQTGDLVYECRARGIFRRQEIKPLPGDSVDFEVTSEKDMEGNITRIDERKNRLMRPEIANVDRIFLMFASKDPAPNFDMLNRYLILMQDAGIEVSLLVTKMDQAEEGLEEKIRELFVHSGYEIDFISLRQEKTLEELHRKLLNKTSAFAGPSGVGKSSLINHLFEREVMETGDLSRKIRRGKNTTRHSEIFCLEKDTYIFDTPGFTSVDISGLLPENIQLYYPEFREYLGKCRFNSCRHLSEPDCAVREAVKKGMVSRMRYKSYASVCEELKSIRRF